MNLLNVSYARNYYFQVLTLSDRLGKVIIGWYITFNSNVIII